MFNHPHHRTLSLMVGLAVWLAGCGAPPAITQEATPTQAPATPAPATPMPEPFRIVGYVTGGNAIVSLIQFDKLTHINYAFLLPQADGTLAPMANLWKLREVVALAHDHGVKVLISVGGWGYDAQFEALAADPATRAAFVGALDAFAREYDLDGIDIDWEYPGPEASSAQNFLSLMRELEAVLRPQGKLLTSAVVAAGANGDGVLTDVFETVDFLNVMAYDGPGPNHSSVEYAEQALDYWSARGLPLEKTVLGVPFYARSPEVPYRKLVEASPEAAGVDSWDYLGSTVYYNGLATMQRKTELALNRASGIMIWALAHDTDDSTSLLNTIYQTARDASP
jgi:GH18 family chitinase